MEGDNKKNRNQFRLLEPFGGVSAGGADPSAGIWVGMLWLCSRAVGDAKQQLLALPLCSAFSPLCLGLRPEKPGRARPRGSPSSTRATLGLLHFYAMQALGKMKP